ncbi:hypothetical protein [Hyphococcus lacteus]|uniref:TonB C-terminal domain-containing protein n=1 Tax=Hyphococcus lacteus TaxID=3143536 RepID=A0ABV3Z371_9PROT
MKIILTLLAIALVLGASPAAAGSKLDKKTPYQAKPRAIYSLDLTEHKIQVLAITKLARADTRLRREHLDDCETMAKIFPGYPQPALVSIDLSLRF